MKKQQYIAPELLVVECADVIMSSGFSAYQLDRDWDIWSL
jgi:hypothetical protein